MVELFVIYKQKMYIYKTTNVINGRVYIGKSGKPFNNAYYGSGILLWKAIRKYGIENFIVEVLEECTAVDQLNEKEKYWIKEYCDYSYNLAEGGTGGWTTKFYTEDQLIEYKKKLSSASKGRTVSDKTRKKISEKNKGKFYANKEKLSMSIKDLWKDPNSVYNTKEYREKLSNSHKIPCKEETKIKISNANSGGNNGMAVKIKVNETIYETRRECAKAFGISETAVTKRCKSKNFPGWVLNNKDY